MKIDFYIDLFNDSVEGNLNMLETTGLFLNTKPYSKMAGQDRVKVTVDFPNHYFKHYSDSSGIATDVEVIKEHEGE